MAALHQLGGVPLRWEPALPPGDRDAGRRAFEAHGCAACHRVAGESFTSASSEARGPDLTGMGKLHPPAYLAEAVLDPDAVVVDGPGWVDADGRSTMPAYADMTLGDLADIVAYLRSLDDAGAAPASCHAPGAPTGATVLETAHIDGTRLPAASRGGAFFAQTYDVDPAKIGDLERWFAAKGRARFLESEGLVRIDTYVDAGKPARSLTTVFAFRDEAALRTFLGDPAMADVWREFDDLVGPHGHVAADRPLAYRAATLSATKDGEP